LNHCGPCGWKIAHQCIGEDHDVPIQCKGNLNESCLRLVHPECMLLWERLSSAITPVDALSQFNLVCPMHRPNYKNRTWVICHIRSREIIPYQWITRLSLNYLPSRRQQNLMRKVAHLVSHLTARQHLTALLVTAIVTVIAAKATNTRDRE
jgi:hypothetical protein